MAKRYDNEFDAEAFVENFRAQDDTPASRQKKEAKDECRPKLQHESIEQTPVCSADEYQERFIDNLKYRFPPSRWPQVMISPTFVSLITNLENICGNRRANLSTFINNVLEQHFNDCEAAIKELKKKYIDNE